MFNDPELNKLEEQVNISNQTIIAASADFLCGARHRPRDPLAVFPRRWDRRGVERRPELPRTISTGGNGAYRARFTRFLSTRPRVPDLWGRVRNTVRANVAAAQVSAADLPIRG